MQIIMNLRAIICLLIGILSIGLAEGERKCPLHSNYTDCGTRCPLTCQRPNSRPCVLICVPDSCVCDQGYILDSNEECVLPEKCTQFISSLFSSTISVVFQKHFCFKRFLFLAGNCDNEKHEALSKCGPASYITCSTPTPNESKTELCGEVGCYCMPGYIRASSANATCIPKEECSSTT